MPLRRIDDGHASPLDMEFLESNLVSRLKALRNEILALQRDANVRPGPNTLTHKMMYQDILPESAKTYSEMNSLDAVRLVSEHEHKMIAGMPAVEDGTLYFEVGAIDDNETLDAGSAAYGMRSGEELELEATVRYHGSGGTISLTHVEATGTEQVIQDVGAGALWSLIINNMSSSAEGLIEVYYSQKITATDPWVLRAVKAYFKRTSTGFTSAKLHMAIYTDYPPATGRPWPNNAYFQTAPPEQNKKVEVTVDVDTNLSTTGEWITFELPAPLFRCGDDRPYHIVFWATNGVGTVSPAGHLYIGYEYPGTYADGYCQANITEDAYWYNANDGLDLHLKLDINVETSTNIITPAVYAGWQEATADVTLRLAHDLWEKNNFADFYLTVPSGMAVNALRLKDKNSGGEVHWRCDHVRTPHIPTIRSGAAANGAVLTADGAGGTEWAPQATPVGLLHVSAQSTSGSTYSQDSSSWTTVRSLASIKLTKACRVCLQAQAIGYTGSSGNPVEIQIYQGDTALGYPSRQPATSYSPLMCVYDYNLAAGTYTWNLKYRRNGGSGTVYVAYIVFNVKAFTTK